MFFCTERLGCFSSARCRTEKEFLVLRLRSSITIAGSSLQPGSFITPVPLFRAEPWRIFDMKGNSRPRQDSSRLFASAGQTIKELVALPRRSARDRRRGDKMVDVIGGAGRFSRHSRVHHPIGGANRHHSHVTHRRSTFPAMVGVPRSGPPEGPSPPRSGRRPIAYSCARYRFRSLTSPEVNESGVALSRVGISSVAVTLNTVVGRSGRFQLTSISTFSHQE